VNWTSFGFGVAAMLAWLLAAIAVAVPLGRTLKRGAGGHPVPGADQAIAVTWEKPPVPGNAALREAAACPPARPAPAPGHDHGRVLYAVKAWECGRMFLWDGAGALTGAHPCGTVSGDAVDAALERILRDGGPP
jgi:hypothetical protein